MSQWLLTILADGRYLSEDDCIHALLYPSFGNQRNEWVLQIAAPAAPRTKQAYTFHDFPQSLLSVGPIANDNTVSLFTKDGVTVHHENDVLITCRGEPIFISVRDDNGRYCVPLVQQTGQWQPRHPIERARAALEQANSM
jgi:hypothetical protein